MIGLVLLLLFAFVFIITYSFSKTLPKTSGGRSVLEVVALISGLFGVLSLCLLCMAV